MLPISAPRGTPLALVGAAASWGIATAISKSAVEELTPLVLLAVQLAVSLIALAVLMRVTGVPFRDPGASPLLGRLGALNPGVAYLLSLLGLQTIGASLSVLVWATEPIWILGLAAIVLGERIGAGVVAASAVALGGVALVVGGGAAIDGLGLVLTMAGVVCCAVYTVVARRWIGTADATAPVLLVQQLYALGVVAVGLAAVAVVGGLTLGPVSGLAWAGAATSGLLYYTTAYWLYLSALRWLPASAASASFYLIPVFGVSASVMVLDERLEPIQWLGAVVVIAAVAAVYRLAAPASPAWPENRRMEPAE